MSSNLIYRANLKETNQPKPAVVFERMVPKYDALKKEELITVNADVNHVNGIVSASAGRVMELSSEIVQLPGYTADDITELHDCADGLDFAEAEYRTTLRTMNELSDAGQECNQTREKFLIDLRNMVAHGVLEEGYLRDYNGGPGFSVMVDDTRLLTRLYRRHWEALSGKTCRTLDEIDRAEVVVHRMVHLMGLKNLGTAEVTRTADMRNRAFTYLVKRYDRIIRAVNFVRHDHGDAELFAPSLYANRGGKKKSQPDKDEAQQPGVQPQQPVIGANGPFVPATPASATGTTAPIPGMPGGSPFIQ